MLVRFQTGALCPGNPFSILRPRSDRLKTVIAEADPGLLGRDLGSGWSPKPASEVRFLGRLPMTIVQGGLGPARPHKPRTWPVRFRPLQLEWRPRAAATND